jgi:hypothetical protein
MVGHQNSRLIIRCRVSTSAIPTKKKMNRAYSRFGDTRVNVINVRGIKINSKIKLDTLYIKNNIHLRMVLSAGNFLVRFHCMTANTVEKANAKNIGE